jgi:hypothetical protein
MEKFNSSLFAGITGAFFGWLFTRMSDLFSKKEKDKTLIKALKHELLENSATITFFHEMGNKKVTPGQLESTVYQQITKRPIYQKNFEKLKPCLYVYTLFKYQDLPPKTMLEHIDKALGAVSSLQESLTFSGRIKALWQKLRKGRERSRQDKAASPQEDGA